MARRWVLSLQRNGRGLRQGNRNPEISIYHYVTEGSFDGYLWQIQEQKLKYITQVMTSKNITRSCEDIDETVLTAAQFKAIATDNPEVLMKMELENRVSELRILQRNYQNEQEKLERKINVTYPKDIEDYKKKIGAITADIEILKQTENADFNMTLDRKTYTERTKAGEMLTALSRSLLQSGEESIEVGEYRGFKLKLMKRMIGEVMVQLEGSYHYITTLGLSGIGDITRIENLAKGIPKQLQLAQQGLDDIKRQLDECYVQYGKSFLYEAELSEKSAKLTEINTTLELGKEQEDDVIMDEDSRDKYTANRDERCCEFER